MNGIILGNSFLKNNSIQLYPRNTVKKLPDLTLQLIERSAQPNELGKPQYAISTVDKCATAPNQQTILKCTQQTKNKQFADLCGIVITKEVLKKRLVCESFLSYTELILKKFLTAFNLQTNEITIHRTSDIAYLMFCKSQQAEL